MVVDKYKKTFNMKVIINNICGKSYKLNISNIKILKFKVHSSIFNIEIVNESVDDVKIIFIDQKKYIINKNASLCIKYEKNFDNYNFK